MATMLGNETFLLKNHLLLMERTWKYWEIFIKVLNHFAFLNKGANRDTTALSRKTDKAIHFDIIGKVDNF